MNDLPVMVVDEAGADSLVLRAARAAHGEQVSLSPGSVHGLQMLERAPVHMLLCPERLGDLRSMDFLGRVRELDREGRHFTFVLLVTEERWTDDDKLAFAAQADMCMSMAEIETELASAIRLGVDMSERINRLLRDNVALEQRCIEFQNTEATDPLTGLGNGRYLEQSLGNNIAQIEARGGAVCLIAIGIGNYEEVLATHGESTADDLVVEVAQKIKRLVRPLDVVTYLGGGQFGLVLNQPKLSDCSPRSYARLFNGVRLKSYRTRAGYIMTEIGMGFCASGAETGPPKQEHLLRTAREKLTESYGTGEICYETFDPLGEI